jgi:hypothetical protein
MINQILDAIGKVLMFDIVTGKPVNRRNGDVLL